MLVLRSRRVVCPDGERPAAVHVDGGVITGVFRYEDDAGAGPLEDVGDLVVSPGVVDTHVHINEPGRTEWEGFDTATRAAAAGGITTLIDMPLNSIPATVDVAALEAKRRAALGRCHVDVGFWGGIVPAHDHDIQPLVKAGVRGFKCFLAPSGVDEFPCVSAKDLRSALPVLAQAAGMGRPLLVHAEDPSRLSAASGDPRAYATYLATRPAQAEVDAVRMIADLADEYHVATHIVHLSSAEGVAAVAAARAAGIAMTAETCPHYLTFAADEIADGATAFKCAPPVRASAHREALWDGLRRGTCQMVATDHSPAPPAMKMADTGDFVAAWGGIASLQISLPAVWTGASHRGFSVADVARWLSAVPAALCGLGDQKGAIRPGYAADLIVWDPDARILVEGARLQHRHALTPYEGRTLRGAVRATYLAGVKIWDGEKLTGAGRGRLL